VSRDLGVTPVDPEVARIVTDAARRFEEAGVIVEEAHPDFSKLHECFHVLRALSYALGKQELLAAHRDKLKPEVIWNIEKGLNLTGAEIATAEAQRGAMFQRTLEFFQTYDLLLCPATIVAAFPVEQRYLAECNGHKFSTYIDWLAIVYAIKSRSKANRT
jgi:amidase